MSRDLPNDVIAELDSSSYSFEYLYYGKFGSTELYLWTGGYNLVHDGKTYLGNGWLQNIGSMDEHINEIRSTSMTVYVSGLPSALQSLMLNSTTESTPGTMSLAFFDKDDEKIHVEPWFAGKLDKVRNTQLPNSSVIRIDYRDELVLIGQEREIRWSPESQKLEYPGDLGADYMPFLNQQRLFWGRPDSVEDRA